MVQALRFVSHVLNDPLAYRLPLDKGTEAQKGMTREGALLKELIEEYGNSNHLTESWSLPWQSVLSSQLWRLEHLYWIENKAGQLQRFP